MPYNIFEFKINELEMEGTNLSWDELTCVGYEVTDSAVEKLCKDMKAFLQDARPRRRR